MNANPYKFTVVFHDHLQESFTSIINRYGYPEKTVEIGAFEGHTCINMVNMANSLKIDYKHIVIDPYDESADLRTDVVQDAFKMFEHNIKVCDNPDSIEFIRKKSFDGLIDLHSRGEKVDFVYIDGDHRAATVLEDIVLSFRLLKIGGILLCDDAHTWVHIDGNGVKNVQQSPKMAIDSFIHCNWDKIELLDLPKGYQVGIRKLME